MKKKFLLSIIVAHLLLSCNLIINDEETEGNFWAYNFVTENSYRVDADLLAEGFFCNVWVEKGSGVSVPEAQAVAYNFDTVIYPKMTNTFGFIKDNMNTMQWADWYGNGDEKLCILLLDIKDDYEAGVFTSYIAGYFWANDFFNLAGSNSRDIIYIDVNPGFNDIEKINEAYMTLAHEMQHMMNFITSLVFSRNLMDTWIDEGLSSAAEWVYLEEHPYIRYRWYHLNGNGNNIKSFIDTGNNFFVWGNRVTNENQYALLDDYATVYLFFQWLRLQADNDTGIYREIITSDYRDHRSVTSAADKFIDSNAGYSQWGRLLRDWLAANYINSSTGRYGYRNDPVLKNIKAHYVPSGIEEINLYPGEGVYSSIPSEIVMPPNGINIRYAGLDTDINEGHTLLNGALLTYNVNTLKSAPAEKGITTGIVPSTDIRTKHSGSRLISPAPVINGPIRIDAGDVFRQIGLINTNDLDISKQNREKANE